VIALAYLTKNRHFAKMIIFEKNILNTNGFYNPLKEMLEKCVSENFMNEKHLQMWTFVKEPEDVISCIKDAENWNKDAINFATNK